MFQFLYHHTKRFLLNIGIYSSNSRYAKAGVIQFYQTLKFCSLKENQVKIGESGDGGYYLPKTLSYDTHCFSGGVGPSSLFEFELAERGGTVSCYDASVLELPHPHDRVIFEKKFLGVVTSENVTTLNHEMNDTKIQGLENIIVKLDIEGAEYEVLLSMRPDIIEKVRILVIEFHYLTNLFDPMSGKIINAVFKKLLQTHVIYNIQKNPTHSNNKKFGFEINRTLEFCFINKADCLILDQWDNQDLKVKNLASDKIFH